MANYCTLFFISEDDTAKHLCDELANLGMQKLGQINLNDSSFQFSPDDLNNLIFALLGSGGIVTAITSYFKYRSKQFEVKVNKEGFTEIKCSNMNREDIKSIIVDIKELIKHQESSKENCNDK